MIRLIVITLLSTHFGCYNDSLEFTVTNVNNYQEFQAKARNSGPPHLAEIFLTGTMSDSFSIGIHIPDAEEPIMYPMSPFTGSESITTEWYGDLSFFYMPRTKSNYKDNDSLDISVRFEYY